MDKTALVARIDSLLATKLPNEKGENTVSTIFEVQQATLTILKAVYGADSPQMATLKDAEARITPWGQRPCDWFDESGLAGSSGHPAQFEVGN